MRFSPLLSIGNCGRLFVLLTLLLVPPLGCGRWAGLAYFAGVGRGTKIPAEYVLPHGKLLILVDDPREIVDLPRTRDLLARHTGRELLAHDAAEAVIDPDSLSRLRQFDVEFDRMTAQEIGRRLRADAILWLQVRDFAVPGAIEETGAAAKITVEIIVLDPREEHRRQNVRLWPSGQQGYILNAQLDAVEVNQLKKEDAIEDGLARNAALLIGRLFYDHTLGDLDDER